MKGTRRQFGDLPVSRVVAGLLKGRDNRIVRGFRNIFEAARSSDTDGCSSETARNPDLYSRQLAETHGSSLCRKQLASRPGGKFAAQRPRIRASRAALNLSRCRKFSFGPFLKIWTAERSRAGLWRLRLTTLNPTNLDSERGGGFSPSTRSQNL